MDLCTSPPILSNPDAINLHQPEGLKLYLQKWNYQKVRSSEIVVENLWRQYHRLHNAGKHNEAKELHKTIRKMDRCRHDFVEYHLKGNPYRKQHRPFYCCNKLCPICYPYQSYERCLQVFSKMWATGGDMYGVYTFSPKNPSAHQLEEQMIKLKTASKKVFDRRNKELSTLINGSIRIMGLRFSYFNGFNSHIHVVLHPTHALTESEAKNLYELLDERFKKFMDIDSVESHLGIYPGALVNIKRTASYLTKYADHQSLSESTSYMSVEAYAAYQNSYAHMREIEFTGCYRGKVASQYSLEDIKQLYQSIHCDNKPPAKLYEFKPVKEPL